MRLGIQPQHVVGMSIGRRPARPIDSRIFQTRRAHERRPISLDDACHLAIGRLVETVMWIQDVEQIRDFSGMKSSEGWALGYRGVCAKR